MPLQKILSEHRRHNISIFLWTKISWESVAKNGKEELTRGEETLAALEVILNNFLTKKIRYFVDFICLQINYANFFKCEDCRNPFLHSFLPACLLSFLHATLLHAYYVLDTDIYSEILAVNIKQHPYQFLSSVYKAESKCSCSTPQNGLCKWFGVYSYRHCINKCRYWYLFVFITK